MIFDMPDTPQKESPALFTGLKPSLLFAIVITVMVISMLVWHARMRVGDFTNQHRLLGEQSVMAAASAISMFISDTHRTINLFAEEQSSALEQLVMHPYDNEAHEAFSNRIRSHFPEYLNFSYTDADGNKLIGGFESKIGSRCVTTINNFVSSDGHNELELHEGLKVSDMPYHFDIMSLRAPDAQDDSVFFLSFRTSELSRILSGSEVAGHRLFLVRQEEPPLIEITSGGDRKQLVRSPVLESDELERVNSSMPVPDTRWKLVELSEASLISGAYTSIWAQTAGIFAGFISMVIIMFLMIVRVERRRSVAEDALHREHDILEHRVEERTEELTVTNSALIDSEQRYLELFENTSDLIQSAGPNGELLFVNRSWRETLGYSKQEVAGLGIADVVHPDSLKHCQEMFQEMLSGKAIDDTEITLVDDAEITFITKDGREIVAEGSTSCKFNNGNPVATRGIYRDITERKNAEKQARTHRKELAQMTRLSTMGEMASALAHELNQPLTSIANYASGSLARLKKSPDDLTPVIAALENIASDAGRTGDFIRHWADFLSRGEMERLPEDLNRTISNAVSLVNTELQQAGVTVILDLADSMPQVLINTIAIQQVILNLVRNSVEAISGSGSESGQITITTSCKDRQSACITVEDTGPGIPGDLIEKIFDPFCTSKESGMGLGLAISRSIIQAHNGKLQAENLPQGGAMIYVTIPLI